MQYPMMKVTVCFIAQDALMIFELLNKMLLGWEEENVIAHQPTSTDPDLRQQLYILLCLSAFFAKAPNLCSCSKGVRWIEIMVFNSIKFLLQNIYYP